MYRIKSRQSGQGLVEVALVIVLVAVVALLAL
ncbi:MAG: prepilin-type N-terminal cleavage/methylation domain-containing protein, partial [Anaerolineae bacterium]|nr:prepilin-type N-terminal cleavage/methylation domain-containing protein [Anaerolineae bacterium]